jgi:hypothetical protein
VILTLTLILILDPDPDPDHDCDPNPDLDRDSDHDHDLDPDRDSDHDRDPDSDLDLRKILYFLILECFLQPIIIPYLLPNLCGGSGIVLTIVTAFNHHVGANFLYFRTNHLK